MHSGFVIPLMSDVEYSNWLLKSTSTFKYFKSTSTLKYFKGANKYIEINSFIVLNQLRFPQGEFQAAHYFENSSSSSFRRPIKH